MLEAKMATRTG